ncbi:alpha/beta-hydrolase [Hypoxylon sp. FL1150]|nr:alpha/beta-hydrolase [Hypoxylon sp. FL1150]
MTSDFITTPDGVRLRYWQEGPASAPNVVFLAGWAQTAAQFKKQVAHFKSNFRVTTYDHRGHGDSDKPAFGYRVARLAADLESLLAQLDLREVTLVGHSMGAAVIWAHWDLFPHPHDRVKKIAIVDQGAAVTADPGWTPEQAAEAGTVFPAGRRFELAGALRGPEWRAAWEGLARSFFSPDVAAADIAWALEQQIKTPREAAATLLLDHAAADWRDVIPRIDVPALVIGARGSLFPVAGLEWIGRQIAGARTVVFEKDEGGFHSMFWENPDKFNRVLEEFLLD